MLKTSRLSLLAYLSGLLLFVGCSSHSELIESNYDNFYRLSYHTQVYTNDQNFLEKGGRFNTKIAMKNKTLFVEQRPFLWDENNNKKRNIKRIAVKKETQPLAIYNNKCPSKFSHYKEIVDSLKRLLRNGQYINQGCTKIK